MKARGSRFTLDEAQAMLPVLQGLLERAMAAKRRVQHFDEQIQSVKSRILLHGGLRINILDLIRQKSEHDRAMQQVKDSLAEIQAAGVQVKDLDIGLLDFPCVVNGRTILLCWKLGEKAITHWHGLEEGFAGRKPIDERIARAGRKN